MEFQANITKKFIFELSLEEIKAIETVFNLVEYIEDTLDNYQIDTNLMTIDVLNSYGDTEDCIAYDDLIAMKGELEFLKGGKKILVEEELKSYNPNL